MSDFNSFFKESDSSLSLFYPRHYIIATFPGYSAAASAYRALRATGFPEDEVKLATGQEVLEFFQHFREDAGLWGIIMRPLSRFLGGEVLKTDEDIQHASEGAGFLAIHCPTEEKALSVMNVIGTYSPSSADWYLWSGVRSFV